jgi:hypothetical protein
MRNVASTWAVVLAGGDGSRLREITRTAAREAVPKQFCSLLRKTCLLEDAIRRAQAVASVQHICSVVAEQHRRWWSGALDSVPEHNIFTQPKNCGTAHGILLALLLQVLRMPGCGWTDLGSPKRVAETIRSLTQVRSRVTPMDAGSRARYLDLAWSLRPMRLPQAS